MISDNHDTLICGNCKEMFHNLSDIIDHKKHYCKLRFTCKCAPKISGSENDGRDSGMIMMPQAADGLIRSYVRHTLRRARAFVDFTNRRILPLQSNKKGFQLDLSFFFGLKEKDFKKSMTASCKAFSR